VCSGNPNRYGIDLQNFELAGARARADLAAGAAWPISWPAPARAPAMSDSVLVACDAIVTAIKKPKKAVAGRRDPRPYPQYVDDGQLALEVALVMRSARCFLQRQP
jgi:hypothetical protein